MFDFLALPTEIRYEIYRCLWKYTSLKLAQPEPTVSDMYFPRAISPYPEYPNTSFGYASYGFYPEILATNSQISHEAKQVLYGENDCTYLTDHFLSSVAVSIL